MPGTVILGAGFGGISVATELRRQLGDGHAVTLVDRRDHFAMGLRKLWSLFGLGSLEEGRRSRERLADRGIRFVKQEIRAVDPEARRVVLDRETIDADRLVIAVGAVARPDLVPGLAEHGHSPWTEEGVPPLRRALESLARGRIVILVAGAPFPCPPAPFECTMLLDDDLRRRGARDRVEIEVATVQPILLPNAGEEGSAWLAEQLGARGIASRAGCKLASVEAGRIVLEDGAIPFDLLIYVPPHRPPAIVRESGLGGEGGWIAVDPGTLATGWPGVYAVGDVTRIQLTSGLPLPKAGIVAELEGARVAAAIAAEVRGEPAPPPYDGRAFCFVEMGVEAAARIDGEFFASPQPRVAIGEVSARHAQDKRRFESDRLARWFGG